MEIKFFLPMNPPTVTQQQHRVGKGKNGKPVFYDSPELAEAKAKLAAHLAKNIPEQPFTRAVQLIVKWCFPVSGKHADGEYKTTKPDTDNLQKTLKDIITIIRSDADSTITASTGVNSESIPVQIQTSPKRQEMLKQISEQPWMQQVKQEHREDIARLFAGMDDKRLHFWEKYGKLIKGDLYYPR